MNTSIRHTRALTGDNTKTKISNTKASIINQPHIEWEGEGGSEVIRNAANASEACRRAQNGAESCPFCFVLPTYNSDVISLICFSDCLWSLQVTSRSQRESYTWKGYESWTHCNLRKRMQVGKKGEQALSTPPNTACFSFRYINWYAIDQ